MAANSKREEASSTNPKTIVSLGGEEVKPADETAEVHKVVPDAESSEEDLAKVSGGAGDFGGGDVVDGGTWS